MLSPEQQTRLVDLLMAVPPANTFAGRTALLGDAGGGALNRNEANARLDFEGMVRQLVQLGARRELSTLIQNALGYARGSDVGKDLQALLAVVISPTQATGESSGGGGEGGGGGGSRLASGVAEPKRDARPGARRRHLIRWIGGAVVAAAALTILLVTDLQRRFAAPATSNSNSVTSNGSVTASAAVSVPTASASASTVSAPTASASASPVSDPTASALMSKCEGMARIPAGTIKVNDSPDCGGPRTVKIDQVFYLDCHEVTVGEYARCKTCKPSFAFDYCARSGNLPQNCVSLELAEAYCKAQGKRLPTDDKWVYAARGDLGDLFSLWNDSELSKHICWNRAQSYTDPNDRREVGLCRAASHDPGAFGLYDMAGSLEEWVTTRPGEHFTRGGNYLDTAPSVIRDLKCRDRKNVQDSEVGFRCAADKRKP